MFHNYFSSITKACLLVKILLLTPYILIAQQSIFFDVSYKDSLVAEKNDNVLYNTVKLTNPKNKWVTTVIKIDAPKNWKELTTQDYLSNKEVYYRLAPKQEKSITFNLLRTPKSSANWDSAVISVWVPGVTDTQYYYYHMRTAVIPRFYAQYITEDIYLEDKPDRVALSVSIKNTGNIIDTYKLKWQNRELDLDEELLLRLRPGQDTIYTHIIKIPQSSWPDLYNKNIGLIIKGSGENSYTHAYKISRPKSDIRKSESAYPVIPITVETGTILQNTNQYYYVGARGNINFADKNNLNFYYKSKRLGNEVYGIQRHIYLVNYNYNSWRLSAGLIQPHQRLFANNGRGVNLSYSKDANTEFAVAAIFKDANYYYTNNGLSLMARYPIKKVGIKHVITANLNSVDLLNGYILSNEAKIVNNGKLSIDIRGGLGIEQKTRDIPGVPKEILGYNSGYSFSYRMSNWLFSSTIDYHSNNFPGLYKGMRMQNHQITINQKRTFSAIFYTANSIRNTYFKDSLYNTDILKYNTERYGLSSGIKDMHTALSISTGIMKHNGLGTPGLNYLYFLDINYSWTPWRHFSFTLNSQNAYKDKVDSKNNNVYLTSSMSSLKFWWFGFMGIYTRRPIFESENTTPLLSYYNETITGGPLVNFNFFRKRLSGSVRYQVSKTVYDQRIRKYIGGNLNYYNKKTSTSVQLTANIPVNNAATGSSGLPFFEEKFITLSLIQQLSIPVPTHKKYYDLHMSAYYDENYNGVKDRGERNINRARIDIGDNEILYTNKNGKANYLNTGKGVYNVKPHVIESSGMIPVNGMEQSVQLNKDTALQIPYNKGKMVSGDVTIINDSFSRTSLDPDRIKITASNTEGRSFVTFTDNSGAFKFNIPPGIYEISLNPEAYNGTDFKPDQISFQVNLKDNDKKDVHFVIRQKIRKVRFLKNN